MDRNELDDKKHLSFGQDDVEEQEDTINDEEDGDEYRAPESEEIPKSLPEESMADEPEEEQSRIPKKRDKAQTRINQIQRDRYQALAALEEARAENERLRQINQATEQKASLSTQAAMRHYDDNVSTRLERAREMQIAAIESGDAQAQADANIEIAAATNAMQELKNWKYKEEYERKFSEQRAQDQAYQQQQAYNAPAYNPNDILLEDWVEKNEWFNPESENHDPELAAAVAQYANQLDYQLANSGYAYRIKTPEYFQHIDNAIRQHVSQRNSQQSNQGRSLNMKSPQGGAYSARNGRSAQAQAQRVGPLTDEQRDMARRMGVSDKQYQASVKYCNENQSSRHTGR
jgi:hypothetical protein